MRWWHNLLFVLGIFIATIIVDSPLPHAVDSHGETEELRKKIDE